MVSGENLWLEKVVEKSNAKHRRSRWKKLKSRVEAQRGKVITEKQQ